MTIPRPVRLWTVAEWARKCGVTHERARQVLDKHPIEGAVYYILSKPHVRAAVLEGTPWPAGIAKEQAEEIPGYLRTRPYALANNLEISNLRMLLYNGRIPGAKKELGIWYIPESLHFVPKLGRPRKSASITDNERN